MGFFLIKIYGSFIEEKNMFELKFYE